MRNSHYIVSGLSDADMLWLLSMGKLRPLKSGELLVIAGKKLAELFFVTRGSFDVLMTDGAHVAVLRQGDVIGEMSFVERHPPSASVRAAEHAEVLAIPREAILARFIDEPVFAARFYSALATSLSEKLRETTSVIRHPREHQELQKATAESQARFAGLLGKILR